MIQLIIILLVAWLVISLLGLLLEGLLWLTVLGVILFVATAAYGWMKRQSGTR